MPTGFSTGNHFLQETTAQENHSCSINLHTHLENESLGQSIVWTLCISHWLLPEQDDGAEEW